MDGWSCAGMASFSVALRFVGLCALLVIWPISIVLSLCCLLIAMLQCGVGMQFDVCRVVCTADGRANLNCVFSL